MCWSSTTIPLQVHTGCFTYVHFHWGLYLNTFFGPVHTINGNTLFAILIFYLKKAVNKLSASKALQSQLFVLVCRLPHAHNKNVMWSPQNGSALDIDQFHQLVNFTMFIRHANSTYEDCGKFWWLKNSKKAVNLIWYNNSDFDFDAALSTSLLKSCKYLYTLSTYINTLLYFYFYQLISYGSARL